MKACNTTKTKKRIFGAIICLAPCLQPAVTDAQSIADFAVRAELHVPNGSAIVRVALPAASIAALRSAEGGDLRVFNATGTSLPHALIDASNENTVLANAESLRVVALPIFNEAAVSTTKTSTPTLRIEEGSARRVIEYSSGKLAEAGIREPRQILFDTRRIDAEVSAVDLEGTLPTATVVKVTLEASADMKNWRTLVFDAPVFDFGADGPRGLRVVLPTPQNLANHYIRLSWTGSASVPIVALRMVGVRPVKSVLPVALNLASPSVSADNAAEWVLPLGLRVTGLHLRTAADNTLMPVRLLTRKRAGEPWQFVASTVVYRFKGGDTMNDWASISPSLPIRSPLAQQLRVEALPRYTLTGIPLSLSLEYPSLQVVFVATGVGPFTVATGKAGMETAALPLTTLIPQYRAGIEFALPELHVTRISGSPEINTGRSTSGILDRTTLLWVVLVLAVAMLAVLAISLLRSPSKSAVRTRADDKKH